MSTLKRALALGLTGVLAVSLTACKNDDKRNQNIPYGNVSTNAVATIGDYSISNRELYNRLKYSNGYNHFISKLESVIYADELTDIAQIYQDNKEKIDAAIVSEVYGSSEVDAVKKALNDEENATISRKKYIQNQAQQGITVRESAIIPTFSRDAYNQKDVVVLNLDATSDLDLIKKYAMSYVRNVAGEEYILANKDKEFLQDFNDENKLVKNSYYIDEDVIESQYNNTLKTYFEAEGVILQFNSLKEANNALKEVSASTTAEKYAALYNNYYAYKNASLTANQIGETPETTFLNNKDYNEISNISSDLLTYFIEDLKDGEETAQPISFGTKYYLVYREKLTYTYTETSEEVDYKELPENIKATVDQECVNLYAETNASSVQNKVYEERLQDLDLKIYDPFLENTFANSYSFYEYNLETNNEFIFSTKDTNYRVDDFYKELQVYNLNSVITNLLINKKLYNEQQVYLEKDAEKDLRSNLKTEIKNFNKGNTSLNKGYGETNYLFTTYGYMTIDEVVINNLAGTIKSAYLSDYIYDNWATDNHEIAFENISVLNNILEAAEANKTTDEDLFYNMNMDHILISVDNNGDGSPDDMNIFLEELNALDGNTENFDTDANILKFKEAVNNLAQAIVKEVLTIYPQQNIMDSLSYVVTAFNRDMNLADGSNWADYKTDYHFTLTAEALGDISETSVSNFVKPFQEYVEDIFVTARDKKLEIAEENESDGQFIFPGLDLTQIDPDTNKQTAPTFGYDNLCLTEYGYHILSINTFEDNSEDQTSLNFKFESTSSNAEDYSDIRVVVNGNDEDDDNDDIYVITDIFNDNADKPSMNQVFIYYVEYSQGGVSSIKTSIKNSLSELLDDAIAKFQNSSFQEYLLVKSLGEITVTGIEGYNFNDYLNYLKDVSENYDDSEDNWYYHNWYDKTWTR